APAPDADGSRPRPGRPGPRGHPPSALFFYPPQLFLGLLVGLLVALALHGVLGTMDRIAFLMQESPQLVVAEADASDLRQMGGQTNRRPVGESVPQGRGVGCDRLLHGRKELGGRAAGTSRRLDGPQRIDPG